VCSLAQGDATMTRTLTWLWMVACLAGSVPSAMAQGEEAPPAARFQRIHWTDAPDVEPASLRARPRRYARHRSPAGSYRYRVHQGPLPPAYRGGPDRMRSLRQAHYDPFQDEAEVISHQEAPPAEAVPPEQAHFLPEEGEPYCDQCHFDGPPAHYWPWWQNLQLFVGMESFRGPVDLGQNANFGLHEGVNYGAAIWPDSPIGFQVGFRGVHTNFYGNRLEGPNDNRDQVFLTAGVFRRAIGCGLQWAVVFDYMKDRYYGEADLNQYRALLSYLYPSGDEIGFYGAFSSDDDPVAAVINTGFLSTTIDDLWKPTDQFRFFYRRHFGCDQSWSFWGGFTGWGDALIGAEVRTVMGPRSELLAGFNYLLPRENGDTQIEEEAWFLGITFLWLPGGSARQQCQGGTFLPLLPVADNGSFMVDREPLHQ